jgi:hypothetical protein
MDHRPGSQRGSAQRSLEREDRLIRGTIALVASGAASRAVVGSLRFGTALLEPARRSAASVRVRVVPLWTLDDAVTALRVERIEDA